MKAVEGGQIFDKPTRESLLMQSLQPRPVLLLAILAVLVLWPGGAAPQPETPSQPELATGGQVSGIEERLDDLEDGRKEAAGGCGLAFLFGAFCALWAQTTGRNPWLWFFLGLFFSVITVIVLLYKNAQDIKARWQGRPPAEPGTLPPPPVLQG